MKLSSNNIILIGFMGSGKTTVAKAVHEQSGLAFIDSDDFIAERKRLSVGEIFQQFGESHFRDLEREFCSCVRESIQGAVISTGGGLPLFFDTRKLGRVFFLKVDFGTLLARLTQEERERRPLFAHTQRAEELYHTRLQTYTEQAHFTLDGTLPPSTLAQQILEKTP